MNRATPSTGWARNPDGTQGYTWNPITGCLNHTPEGLCLGGMFPCYAHKLANGRLRSRYLANQNVAYCYYKGKELIGSEKLLGKCNYSDPFYPRFWEDRLNYGLGKPNDYGYQKVVSPKGIFVCDMSDLFGIGIPAEWTNKVLDKIKEYPEHRFYLLTKQPQNLARFSPFPDNCWVGVTATDNYMFKDAMKGLIDIQAKVKYISFEPLLSEVFVDPISFKGFYEYANMPNTLIDWVIIGAQSKPKKLPKWDWALEIIMACDKANIPVFLKDNLGLPRLSCEGATPFYKRHPSGTMELRQEMPVCQKPQ